MADPWIANESAEEQSDQDHTPENTQDGLNHSSINHGNFRLLPPNGGRPILDHPNPTLQRWNSLLKESRNEIFEEFRPCQHHDHTETLEDVQLPDALLSRYPHPERTTFLSEEHYAVVNLIGAKEQQKYEDAQAVKLSKTPIQFHAIKMPGSAWNNKEAENTHGIPADGTLRDYFLVANLAQFDKVIGVGEVCTIYLPSVKANKRPIPPCEDIDDDEDYKDPVGIPHEAKRTSLPPGTHTDCAMFALRVASQSPWIRDMHKPPLILDLPSITLDVRPDVAVDSLKLVAPLHTFGSMLEAREHIEKVQPPLQEQDDEDISETKQGPVLGLISYEPNDRSTRVEAATVARLPEIPRSSMAYAQVRFLRDFSSPRPSMNLLQKFPALAKAIRDGVFTGEHAEAANMLATNGGHTYITGYPGTGKSFFCAKVVTTIIAAKGRAYWLTPSNIQTQDAIERVLNINPDINAIRLRPWEREIGELLHGQRHWHVFDTGAGSEHDQALAKHATKTSMIRDCTSPSRTDRSLADVARQIAANDDYDREKLQRMDDKRVNDPEAFEDDIATWSHFARTLLGKALHSVQFIASTPVTFARFMNHADRVREFENPRFHIGVVDEAGKVNEPQSLIPLVHTPSTPVLWVCDMQTLGPMSFAADDTKFQAMFLKQRKVAAMKRIQDMDHIDIILVVNHRARGDTARWAAQYLYNSGMILASGLPPLQKLAYKAYSLKYFGQEVTGTAIFVDAPMGHETRNGSGWVNHGEAELAMAIVRYIYAHPITPYTDKPGEPFSTLILTPFSAQAKVIAGHIKRANGADFPKHRVECRRADESSGSQANVVISCDTRTSNFRFHDAKERVNIIATRAMDFYIRIGREQNLGSRSRNFVQQWCEPRNAVVRLTYLQFCTRCGCPGHRAHGCSVKFKCSICVGAGLLHSTDHSIARCPKAAKFPYVSTKHPHTDGVDKNPFVTHASTSTAAQRVDAAAGSAGNKQSVDGQGSQDTSAKSEQGQSDIQKKQMRLEALMEQLNLDGVERIGIHPVLPEEASEDHAFDGATECSGHTDGLSRVEELHEDSARTDTEEIDGHEDSAVALEKFSTVEETNEW